MCYFRSLLMQVATCTHCKWLSQAHLGRLQWRNRRSTSLIFQCRFAEKFNMFSSNVLLQIISNTSCMYIVCTCNWLGRWRKRRSTSLIFQRRFAENFCPLAKYQAAAPVQRNQKQDSINFNQH